MFQIFLWGGVQEELGIIFIEKLLPTFSISDKCDDEDQFFFWGVGGWLEITQFTGLAFESFKGIF